MKVSPQTFLKFVAPRAGKPMIYPYTWGARFAHFNPAFHFKHDTMFRYSLFGFAIMFPFIWYIDSLVNSPKAKAAYKAALKREHEKEHLDHMWADISGRYAKR